MNNVRQQFAAAGLNLWATFRLDTLPDGLRRSILNSDADRGPFDTLLLLGSAGTDYWRAMMPLPEDDPHPVDHYAIAAVKKAFSGKALQILYPGNSLLPLAALGMRAGWHYPSPLGLGIHPEHGLWFAYRILALVSAETADEQTLLSGDHPCKRCKDMPCITTCPAKATAVSGPDIKACTDYRLGAGSVCAETCLAREACPVGKASRYDTDQLHYHYRFSLNTIRQHQTEID